MATLGSIYALKVGHFAVANCQRSHVRAVPRLLQSEAGSHLRTGSDQQGYEVRTMELCLGILKRRLYRERNIGYRKRIEVRGNWLLHKGKLKLIRTTTSFLS
ncbi:uncharacterized protein LOC128878492 [Hylaeus volcanicus]|uniref:uncharacterized protein LOC128878492 n=1 Tax=Hylaeus volcanicus TaxID=313075 RepID=UPI0023B79F68|nr:uncharacterized protein LOC128878492 [Hylaeus volcanicus]